MYLHCPRCRLTVYRRVEESAITTCSRCGGEAHWLSPPYSRVPVHPGPGSYDEPDAGRYRLTVAPTKTRS